jgi:hypothetical protein
MHLKAGQSRADLYDANQQLDPRTLLCTLPLRLVVVSILVSHLETEDHALTGFSWLNQGNFDCDPHSRESMLLRNRAAIGEGHKARMGLSNELLETSLSREKEVAQDTGAIPDPDQGWPSDLVVSHTCI